MSDGHPRMKYLRHAVVEAKQQFTDKCNGNESGLSIDRKPIKQNGQNEAR